MKEAIPILLIGGQLLKEYNDHVLQRNLTDYQDFYLRHPPKGTQLSDANNVVIIYKIEDQDLVFVIFDIGFHDRLFSDPHKSQK